MNKSLPLKRGPLDFLTRTVKDVGVAVSTALPGGPRPRCLLGADFWVVLCWCLLVCVSVVGRAGQVDLNGPTGSGAFGWTVAVLPNGNFVVTDPDYDAPGSFKNVGAVYLYDGATLALLSTLTGSLPGDRVGYSGITLLSNGNFVVLSPYWNANRGAVTWGSGTTGVSGVVSAANSLVGSTPGDDVGFLGVGSPGITALSNGNYVVRSLAWNGQRGAVTWGSGTAGMSGVVSAANSLVGSAVYDRVGGSISGVVELDNGNYVVGSGGWNNRRGAATWGSGTTGVKGVLSAANSLVGSTAEDQVGAWGIVSIGNGNYLVLNPRWSNGTITEAGAVTWGNGTTGVRGLVSAVNSLVGSSAREWVGSSPGITVLGNGNYVVRSTAWNGHRGAVTWGNGTGGVSGMMTEMNSLVGSTAYDVVGSSGITVLGNGDYVVLSPFWNNGTATRAGAATWGSGTTGVKGVVSAANSLVGNTAYDEVGSMITVLGNGNYVVSSPHWNRGTDRNVGAVTWGSGTTGVKGVVSAANSLVGSTAGDRVGRQITALANGNYVVGSSFWDNGQTSDVGAATWGSGTEGVKGAVSAANSLVGGSGGASVSYDGITALSNGNYVVGSRHWNTGTADKMGAVTWGSGTAGVKGVVSAANSLVGSAAYDQVGLITTLSNGNYVVWSPDWNGSRGAVTWGSGTAGVSGVVSASNSMVGSTADDRVGFPGPIALSNGNYLVPSVYWDNGTIPDVGAVTWGNGTIGVKGVVSAANSLVGSTAFDSLANPFMSGSTITPLSNGNYVVRSPNWDNGAAYDAGAVTWGNGTTGVSGVVSSANSLVGGTAQDFVGRLEITALPTGNYVLRSPDWDNGVMTDVGAVTLGDGLVGTSGYISSVNSLLGSRIGTGNSISVTIDSSKERVLVGFPAESRVSLRAIQGTVTTILEEWRLANFGTSSNSGSAADRANPDGDAYDNLLEFVFGTDPNSAASGPGDIAHADGVITLRAQPALNVIGTPPDGADFQVVFGRRRDWSAAGLDYSVEFSADLVNWEPSANLPVVVASDAGMDAVTVRYPPILTTGPSSGRTPQFCRVRVNLFP